VIPGRPRPARNAHGDSGFTLLEVLVALAILGLAVVASIQAFAQGLRLLKLSGDHQQAMLLADLKVREVVTPEEGREERDEGRFHWERTTKLVPAPELTPLAGPLRWHIYEIAVRVSWDERRQVEITTLRTVPAQPAPGPPSLSPRAR
jgi:general secretion pathway protein I